MHLEWADFQEPQLEEVNILNCINHHHFSDLGKITEQGKKTTNRKRFDTGKKQSIQRHSTDRRHILKPKFYGKKPLSNHDLIEWCDYLNIPINDVLSRDMKVPHNHKQALFIYNLEPSYMSGSHWVATYVKNGVINYFDSFGMPPFQEIVNHAKRENLTLLHQDQPDSGY